MSMSKNKRYGIGVVLVVFGCAGMAEAVTGQGIFMVGAIMFSIGFGLILSSYVWKK